MGVQIADILEKHAISFSEINGKVAIDAFNTLYQFLAIIRQKDGTPLMDSEGKITSHISGLFYRTCNLLEKGVNPIFVFDGKPSELKKRTVEERKARKRNADEELLKARETGDIEEMRVYAQQTSRLTTEMIEDAKHLLGLMGVPIVEAKSEGEAQCAQMCAKGLVEATGSQDFDSLLFGTPILIKNLTIAGRRKLPRKNIFVDVVPEKYFLDENMQKLGIDRRKLVWIGILAGTDFNEGIYGIGARKALKLVKQHDSFEAIESAIGKKIDYEPVEELFLHPEYKEVSREELKLGRLDKDKVMDYMLSRSFSIERIEGALQRAVKEPLGSKQSGLDKWF